MKTSLMNSSRLKKPIRVLLGIAAWLLIIAIVVTIAYLASPGVRTTVDTKVRPFLFGTLFGKCEACRFKCSYDPYPLECEQTYCDLLCGP